MLFFPRPYTQETLLSYIYRVAKAHELSNLDWIFELINKDLGIDLTPEKVNWLSGQELKAIAEYLGIKEDEAINLTVYNYFMRYQIEVSNESKNTWFLYKKSRFCPLCLKGGLFQRKNWINCHSTICVEHNIFLIDKCHICKNIQNIKSIILDECATCKIKLSDTPFTTNKLNDLIEYQKLINQILFERKFLFKHPWINDPYTFLKALDFLALWVVKLVNWERLSIDEYNLHFEENILERNHLKNYRSINQVITLYRFVFNILNNWPKGFHEFLDNVEVEKSDLFTSFLKHGIPKLINTTLWNISRALTNYVAINIGNLKSNDFVRSDEIRFIYKEFNGGLFNSPVLTSYKIRFKNYDFNLIDYQELDGFVDKYKECYTKEELRKRWGTSPKATLAILNDGLIKGAFCYKVGSAHHWTIPFSSVNLIENTIEQRSFLYNEDSISFNQAVEWIGPEKANTLLAKILNGSVKTKNFSTRLSNLLLSKRDVYFELRHEIIQLSSNCGKISIRELCFILGVKKSDILF